MKAIDKQTKKLIEKTTSKVDKKFSDHSDSTKDYSLLTGKNEKNQKESKTYLGSPGKNSDFDHSIYQGIIIFYQKT